MHGFVVAMCSIYMHPTVSNIFAIHVYIIHNTYIYIHTHTILINGVFNNSCPVAIDGFESLPPISEQLYKQLLKLQFSNNLPPCHIVILK